MKNKIIVLQKFDSDRNGKLCDIEEDEEIADKSEVKILLFEIPSDLVAESTPISVITSPTNKLIKRFMSRSYILNRLIKIIQNYLWTWKWRNLQSQQIMLKKYKNNYSYKSIFKIKTFYYLYMIYLF